MRRYIRAFVFFGCLGFGASSSRALEVDWDDGATKVEVDEADLGKC